MRQMRLKDQILLLAEVYGAAVGRKDGRVSYLALGSGDKLKRLRAGKGMISDNIEDGIEWFSENWPEGVAWPVCVPRPDPRPLAVDPSPAGPPP